MAMLSMDRIQIPSFVQHTRQTYSSVVSHGTELILSTASETCLFASSSGQVSITELTSASDVSRALAIGSNYVTVASTSAMDAMVCIDGDDEHRAINPSIIIDEDACLSSPLDISSSSISVTEAVVVSPSLRLPPRPPLQGSGGSGSLSSVMKREKKVTILLDAVPVVREGAGEGEGACGSMNHHHGNHGASLSMSRAEHDQRAASAWAAKKSLRKDNMGVRCKSAVDLHDVELESEIGASPAVITELRPEFLDFWVHEVPAADSGPSSSCHPESQTASVLAHAHLGVPSGSGQCNGGSPFPCLRSGKSESIGSKSSMEDVSCLIDDLVNAAGFHAGALHSPVAFYGVFDGHGGSRAASFCSEHMVRELVTLLNRHAPQEAAIQCSSVLAQVFANTDLALRGVADMDAFCGTTALVALLLGRSLFVANAGDCRAVLSVRGACLPLTKDHKPSCEFEHQRVRDAGGYIEDGYVNGNLSVTRALGDFYLKEVCVRTGRAGPLICEPEVRHHEIREGDEFLIAACDGLWDVFTNQNAVDFARTRLMEANDPQACCDALVAEALKRGAVDNVSVVLVCFMQGPPVARASMVRRGAFLNSRLKRSWSTESISKLKQAMGCLGDDTPEEMSPEESPPCPVSPAPRHRLSETA